MFSAFLIRGGAPANTSVRTFVPRRVSSKNLSSGVAASLGAFIQGGIGRRERREGASAAVKERGRACRVASDRRVDRIARTCRRGAAPAPAHGRATVIYLRQSPSLIFQIRGSVRSDRRGC